MVPGITEYLFTAVLFFNIGHEIGYWQHSSEHRKRPTKQIVIGDSTKVVNIYVDKRGNYWSDPHFRMGYTWEYGLNGTRVIVFHKGGKKWKKKYNHKRWKKHLRKTRFWR